MRIFAGLLRCVGVLLLLFFFSAFSPLFGYQKAIVIVLLYYTNTAPLSKKQVAKLFADASTATLTSFISPYKADRKIARDLHAAVAVGDAPIPFIEVYVDIPIEVAEQRDPKG